MAIKSEATPAPWPDTQRLRQALADTHLRPPRSLADLELPARAQHLLNADVIKNLRPAAVLVPVVERSNGLWVLFTLRADNLRRHAGQISFPGGSSDPDDSDAVATALRESHEEISLDPQQVEIIGYLDDYPTITGFRVTPVVGLLSGGVRLVADAVEVTEIFEVPLDYLLDKKNYVRKHIQRGGMNVPYYCVDYDHYRIWGATAAMCHDLCNKINKAI